MTKRSTTIAIIGPTNAGKSTLVNALVGEKISIVTHKVQTTRTQVMGVLTQDQTQVVFIDTPGIFSPRKTYEKSMVKHAWSSLEAADQYVLILDSERGLTPMIKDIFMGLKKREITPIIALNKIDRVPKPRLLPLITEISQLCPDSTVYLISALKKDHISDLLDHLVREAPEGEWQFPEDQLSNLPDKIYAAEVTREKIFLRLHQELPYHIKVQTEYWQTEPNGSLTIRQLITTSSSQHKSMILGSGGHSLKAIGIASRQELEQTYENKVNLFLHVTIKKDWQSRPEEFDL